MKHYPITVLNIKASACVESTWNYSTISIKIPHRKGQKVKIIINSNPGIYPPSVDDYPTYTAIRFLVENTKYIGKSYAIQSCINSIQHVYKYINMEASDALITKELLNILG